MTPAELRRLSYDKPTVQRWAESLSGSELANLTIELCALRKRKRCRLREVYLAFHKAEIGFFR